jgi:hypothetical protein
MTTLRVVQFLHPGREHGQDGPGWKDWTLANAYSPLFQAWQGRLIWVEGEEFELLPSTESV